MQPTLEDFQDLDTAFWRVLRDYDRDFRNNKLWMTLGQTTAAGVWMACTQNTFDVVQHEKGRCATATLDNELDQNTDGYGRPLSKKVKRILSAVRNDPRFLAAEAKCEVKC